MIAAERPSTRFAAIWLTPEMSHDPAEFQLASEPAVTVENGQPGSLRSGGLVRPARFRLLDQWEKIEEGDEMLEEDCETWSRVPFGAGKTVAECWMIGCRWNAASMVPFRRPTPNNHGQTRSPNTGEARASDQHPKT